MKKPISNITIFNILKTLILLSGASAFFLDFFPILFDKLIFSDYIRLYLFPFLIFADWIFLPDFYNDNPAREIYPFSHREFTYTQVFKLILLFQPISTSHLYPHLLIHTVFLWSFSLIVNIEIWQAENSTVISSTSYDEDLIHDKFHEQKLLHNQKAKRRNYAVINFLTMLLILFYCGNKWLLAACICVFNIFITFPIIIRQSSCSTFNFLKLPRDISTYKNTCSLDHAIFFTSWCLPFCSCIFFSTANNALSIFTIIFAISFLIDILKIFDVIFQKNNYGESETQSSTATVILQIIKLFALLFLLYSFNFLNFKFDAPKFNFNMEKNVGILASIISAVFIFNFSAMYTLLKSNYEKFSFIWLLKFAVAPMDVIIAIVLPCTFILFSFLENPGISKYGFGFFSCAIIYSVGSSVYLIFNLKKILNPKNAARYLVASTTEYMIAEYKGRYKNYIYAQKEDFIPPEITIPLDGLLQLCQYSIEKKEYVASKTVFDITFSFLQENLKIAFSNTYTMIDRNNNEFNRFFMGIFESINNSNSYVIRSDCLFEIQKCFIRFVQSKNLEYYRILYNRLESFARLELQKKTQTSTKTANHILQIMISPCSRILSKLPIDSKSKYINTSDQFHNFQEVVLDNVIKILKTAMELKNSSFLKDCYIFGTIFSTQISEEFDNAHSENTWNWNYLSTLQKLDYAIINILRQENFTKDDVDFVLREFKGLKRYLALQNRKRNVIQKMYNVFFNDLNSIFLLLINSNYELNVTDFDIFFDRPYMEFSELEERSLRHFLGTLEYYFNEISVDILSDANEKRILEIWLQTEHIFENLNDKSQYPKFLEDDFSKFLIYFEKKMQEIKGRFQSLLSNYDKYKAKKQQENEQIIEVLKKSF